MKILTKEDIIKKHGKIYEATIARNNNNSNNEKKQPKTKNGNYEKRNYGKNEETIIGGNKPKPDRGRQKNE